MNTENEERLGTVKIADDVIAVCVAAAVMKTGGVARLSGGFSDNFPKNFLGKDPLSRGVKVSQGEDGINIDVYVIVEYECKIPVVAWDIQGNVKREVERITGEAVKAVNIHVQGVNFPEEEATDDKD